MGTNLFYRDSSDYWTFNPNNLVSTDVFDGMQIEIDPGVEIPRFSYSKSGWLNGEGIMRITPSQAEGIKMPWKYQIIFTDDDSAYVGVASSGTVRDELGSSISPRKIMQPALNFYIQKLSQR